MKKLILCLLLVPTLVYAEKRIVSGTVTEVTPNYSTIESKTPVRECRTVEVPVTKKKQGSDDVLSFIVGAAIGSAVGNQVSGESGAGTVGAIVGGALANEHQKKYSTDEEIVGYKQVDQCSTVYNTDYKTIITDYTVKYNVLGQDLYKRTKKELYVGQKVDVFVNFDLRF